MQKGIFRENLNLPGPEKKTFSVLFNISKLNMEQKTEPFVCSHDFVTVTIISTRFRSLSTQLWESRLFVLSNEIMCMNIIISLFQGCFWFDLVYGSSKVLLDLVNFNCKQGE